jgi:hypothetical protein
MRTALYITVSAISVSLPACPRFDSARLNFTGAFCGSDWSARMTVAATIASLSESTGVRPCRPDAWPVHHSGNPNVGIAAAFRLFLEDLPAFACAIQPGQVFLGQVFEARISVSLPAGHPFQHCFARRALVFFLPDNL